eukprot:TRINITY_DN31209_c0_g1_i1.p1 TRINITY_DN31209_c0_g1~~TRINITY_DN31209_c0_g1_i1.p1  ORF type:complete len:276 (-),score=35.65 TRINITY_DN31209_c0_g1_i1:56-802(-)
MARFAVMLLSLAALCAPAEGLREMSRKSTLRSEVRSNDGVAEASPEDSSTCRCEDGSDGFAYGRGCICGEPKKLRRAGQPVPDRGVEQHRREPLLSAAWKHTMAKAAALRQKYLWLHERAMELDIVYLLLPSGLVLLCVVVAFAGRPPKRQQPTSWSAGNLYKYPADNLTSWQKEDLERFTVHGLDRGAAALDALRSGSLDVPNHIYNAGVCVVLDASENLYYIYYLQRAKEEAFKLVRDLGDAAVAY